MSFGRGKGDGIAEVLERRNVDQHQIGPCGPLVVHRPEPLPGHGVSHAGGARPVRIKPKRISPHPAESPRRRPYAVRVGDFSVTVEPKLVRGGPNSRSFAVEPTGAPFATALPARNAPNRHLVRQISRICAKRHLKTRYLRRFGNRRAPGLMCLSPWSRSPGLVAGSKEAQGAPGTPCRPNADDQLGASKKKKPWPTLPHLSRRLGIRLTQEHRRRRCKIPTPKDAKWPLYALERLR
jgi:hypothetical protein